MAADNRDNPGIKIPFLSIDKPIVEGTRCVEVRIPDDDAYMPVLGGLIAVATKWFNYQRDDAHTGKQIADLWKAAYLQTDWEGCMTCEDVENCIETDEGVRQEIRDIVGSTPPFDDTPVGTPLSETELNRDLAAGTNPGCDLDILWGQCLALTRQFNLSITDTLERVEVATNVSELLSALEELPLVKYVANIIGASAAFDLINYFQESFQEQYLAEYDQAVEYDLACALFCVCRDDCSITVDRIFDVYAARVTSLIADPDAIGTLVDLIEVVAGLEFDSTIVVDLCFFFCGAAWKLGKFLFGGVVDFGLEVLLQLAVSEADADWLLLCDCGSDWNYTLDSTTDPVWVTYPQGTIGGTVITQTTVNIFGQDVTGIVIQIEFPSVVNLTGIRINALETVGVEGAGVVNRFWSLEDSSHNLLAAGDLPILDDAWEVFEGFDISSVKYLTIAYHFIGTTQEMTWQPVMLFGFGTNPFI